jgi:thiol-disulfide isomerase/thioredoxin
MNKTTWLVIVAIIILGGGTALYAKYKTPNNLTTKDAMMQEKPQNNTVMDNSADAMSKTTDNKDNGITQNQDSAMTNTAVEKDDKKMMMAKGSYIAYSPTALTEALKNGKALLFFHAGWCPMCQADEKSINENLSKIPDGLTILKVDYDAQKDLKTQYGITYQNTYVELDSSGKVLTKFNNGGQGINNILANIK